MEKNINLFSSAKFGDRFKTRDGRMAVYIMRIGNVFVLQPELQIRHIRCYYDGKSAFTDGANWADIISRWDEPIDEEKLDKLALEAFANKELTIPYDDCVNECMECFKAGYRRALNM